MMEIVYDLDEIVVPISHCLMAGRAAIVSGPPGVGKTDCTKEIADKLQKSLGIQEEVKIVKIEVPLLSPTDYAIPFPDRETGEVKMYLSELLPKKGPALVVFDDLAHGKPAQVQPVATMLLERRIANFIFPEDVFFMATANREEDLAAAYSLPSHINNRLFHFTVGVNPDKWLKWATENDVDVRVRMFIKTYPQYLHEIPQEGVSVFPTPRSWNAFSDSIKKVKEEKTLRMLCQAGVGANISTIFMSWLKYLSEFDWEKALKVGMLPEVRERAQLFAQIASLTSKLKNTKTMQKHGDGALKIFNQLEGEYKILFLKELIVYKGKNANPDTKLIEHLAALPGGDAINSYLTDLFSPSERV